MCCFKCLYSTDNKWMGDMIIKFMKIIKKLDEVDTFFEKKFKKIGARRQEKKTTVDLDLLKALNI